MEKGLAWKIGNGPARGGVLRGCTLLPLREVRMKYMWSIGQNRNGTTARRAGG
jgi:hypothetical protein